MVDQLGISPRQAHVKITIELFIQENGYSPTYKELAEIIGTPWTNIGRMINILHERGHLLKIHGLQRSIRVIKDNDY